MKVTSPLSTPLPSPPRACAPHASVVCPAIACPYANALICPLTPLPRLHPAHQARAALCRPGFVLTAVSGGLVMAWFGAWSGVLASALTKPQGHFTNAQAGLLGALVTFAGVCA